MAIAIVLVLIVLASVVFHFWSPWWITPLASNWSDMDDTLMITFWVTGAVFIAINLFMAYTVVRYRHKEGSKAAYEPENKKLEWWLTILTTIGVVIMLAPGLIVYNDFVHAPDDAAVVEVLGKQWQWAYRFPGDDGVLGNSEMRFVSFENPFGLDPDDPNAGDDVVVAAGELHLPVNQPTQVLLRSKDVLHDFYVPHFRAKMDMVPGVISSFWFTPTRVGKFDSGCAEYCGVGHFAMRSFVIVDEPDDFQKWLEAQPRFSETLATASTGSGGESVAKGLEVATAQGCLGCHSIDGSASAGPTWKGLYGKTETLEDGSTIVVDEAYIREAISNPGAALVKGFAGIMPPYQLSEEDLKALIDYTRSLSEGAGEASGDASGGTASGREVAEQQGCLGCHTTDGSPSVGPTWKGLFGSEQKLNDGTRVVADEDFFKESVEDPAATVIEGFAPIMPPYKLSAEQLDALVAYAKSLGSG
ncbi:MAG: cytochrome c oxidase subunit II [Gammaproteobacteria bacterium]